MIFYGVTNRPQRLLREQFANIGTDGINMDIRLDHKCLEFNGPEFCIKLMVDLVQISREATLTDAIVPYDGRHESLVKQARISFKSHGVRLLAQPHQVSDPILLDHFPKRLIDFKRFQRLQKIIFDAKANSFLRVVKMPVTADDDEIDRGIQRLRAPDQLDSVVARHSDIGNHDIRPVFHDQRKC